MGSSKRALKPKRPSKSRVRLFDSRHLSKKDIELFWQKFESQFKGSPLTQRRIGELRLRVMLHVKGPIYGTVREFDSPEHAQRYVQKAKEIANIVARAKPNNFVFVPAQLINRRGSFILERVYPTISLFDLVARKENIFRQPFLMRMVKKISFQNLLARSGAAYEELVKILNQKHIHVDNAQSNVLLIDFSKENDKMYISLVDFGGSKPTVEMKFSD